jgi:hypothetical protein
VLVLADIASGHVDASDVLLLIAAIVFVVAAIGTLTTSIAHHVRLLACAGLALVSVALLVL